MQANLPKLTELTILRRNLRRQRAALTPKQQRHLSRAMLKQLRCLRVFRAAKHIALYLPIRGEADPTAIRQYALPHQHFYLPVIAPQTAKPMLFIPWQAQTRLGLNRFGILEPQRPFPRILNPRQFDLVITPLVAFDQDGNRLGMGGGFYDRTFAFKRHYSHHTRPYLLGIAYSFQQVDSLPIQPWDIPLNAVITEKSFISF